MYESRKDPPIAGHRFARRLVLHVATAAAVMFGSLLMGMAGYAWFEGLAWRDAFLNAAMLLGGMGPVESPHTNGGKVFAGIYALYAGIVFLVVSGLILVPFVHRLLHRFHWDGDNPRNA